MEHYITEIRIEKLRHLSDIGIELNPKKRTNLMLTGKNGSGKTTVLKALKNYLKVINEDNLYNLEVLYPKAVNDALVMMENAKTKNERFEAEDDYHRYLQMIENYKQGITVAFNEKDGLEGLYQRGIFLTAFYGADREISIRKPDGVENVVLDTCYSLDSNPGTVLLKYMVHLKTQQLYAKNENDMDVVHMLDVWFERFLNALRVLLDNPDIQLKYNYKTYDFEIIESERKSFGFDQLSDGYSAAIQIVADLILRMEQNWLQKGSLSSYDTEGIVLIDELETHLHISLQKTILPFLTEFFPNIQFIVATHSPYVLNSIDNCVIYDLENNIRMEDMSAYSAEGIVEGYFGVESYSKRLLQRVRRYKELVELTNPTDDERAERAKISVEMKQVPGDLAWEAKEAFEEIESRRKHHD
ncbi:AAA family ATPase [Sporofaciens musculi]|jgi:predicted ATP-dependent endonuclease of OLD family|uniref:AAA family ATPase n=3 Tax=Sporofaciens musculi TaxID=2681861 RepID=UPI0025A2B6A1|nr:AAA family ATPase [Sporofaciens musculi]